VKRLLNDVAFDPEWLELEITENTLIENFERVIENVEIFREMGIKFSIDDFGTGYSSLSYLKSLKISTLKIDRAFIKDILVDKDDYAIVKAIISMGHALNYKIIAEGAEEKEEVELLYKMGCDIVQGYYFSKPLSELELLDFMQKYKMGEKVGL
jgi:EAL domain-containing protein (putative c-di-GMP-specific phosphodiesterase class I)